MPGGTPLLALTLLIGSELHAGRVSGGQKVAVSPPEP